MQKNYLKISNIYKAMSEETRLQIIDLLSCEELCACDILEYFHITQSTLSYHMKYLIDSGIINARKDGVWVKYSLNKETTEEIINFTNKVFNDEEECICKDMIRLRRVCKK